MTGTTEHTKSTRTEYTLNTLPLVQDLTPLEIVLDKEPWMDEIPEDDMLGSWLSRWCYFCPSLLGLKGLRLKNWPLPSTRLRKRPPSIPDSMLDA